MKRSFFHTLASFFALLCIVFIPFPFYITKVQYDITDLVFGKLTGSPIYSDSQSMYLLLLWLFILSLLTSLVLQKVRKWPQFYPKAIAFIKALCFYYLALQMLKYGLDKVFKNQFYLPEPNTLYTPLGQLDKDILYWSSMGTSHFYSVFMGLLETTAAVFLFIKRTRLVGLLMSLAILLNVIAVNIGFDIGVKLYSLFLFFLVIYLLVPYVQRVYQLLLTQKEVTVKTVPSEKVFTQKIFLAVFIKCLIIGLILLEAFYPFVRSGNFNGDTAKRPYLHGAYEVKQMIRDTDTLFLSASPIKRFFVHSHNYIIFQYQDDRMQDYKFSYDNNNAQYVLIDYDQHTIPLTVTYTTSDSMLSLRFRKNDQDIGLTGKAIDWRKLPALRKSFHWTADHN